MAVNKERLDIALVRRGMAPSRERARALIMAGQVVVADHLVCLLYTSPSPRDS